MMNCKVLFLFAVILVTASVSWSRNVYGKRQRCPYEFKRLPRQRNCYHFSKDRLTWHEARIKCHELEGFLAIISSRSESNAITNELIKEYPPQRQTDDIDFWIAGNDILDEGFYKWDSTERFFTVPQRRQAEKFQNWEDDEPNQDGPTGALGAADCVRINNNDTQTDDIWKWADWNCSETFNYLCELIPGREFRCNNSPRRLNFDRYFIH